MINWSRRRYKENSSSFFSTVTSGRVAFPLVIVHLPSGEMVTLSRARCSISSLMPWIENAFVIHVKSLFQSGHHPYPRQVLASRLASWASDRSSPKKYFHHQIRPKHPRITWSSTLIPMPWPSSVIQAWSDLKATVSWCWTMDVKDNWSYPVINNQVVFGWQSKWNNGLLIL